MSYRIAHNPDDLSYDEILGMIKYCPICGTPWEKGRHQCQNKECKVKVRIAMKAYNWWLFYPRCNAWAHWKD